MDKIIFERGEENSYEGVVDDFDETEPRKITFDISCGITIYGFKMICKRLASAIGYCQESIDEEFGDDTVGDEELAAQAHIHDILKPDVIDKYFDMPPTGSEK